MVDQTVAPSGISDEDVAAQQAEGERAKAAANDVLDRVDAHLERISRALEIIAGGKDRQAWEEIVRERRND